MTKSYDHTTKRNLSHLSATQGGKLEILAKEDRYTQNQIAKILSVNQKPSRILNDETLLEVFSKEKKLAHSA